ncbi:MAG: hypothetical protein Q8M40_04205 [Legionella sp.]|nr:hypothetical protein [Legionella sp.]
MRFANYHCSASKLLFFILSLFFISSVHSGTPLWTLQPTANSQTTQAIPQNGSAIVQYTVQNQSNKTRQLVIEPTQGLTQTGSCIVAPKGQAGSTCVLNLSINGAALPASGIHGGPRLCQTNANGTPNLNQCYQPSQANSLNISRTAATASTISASPLVLGFTAGSNGVVTVTNSAQSTETANDIAATIPGGSGISVQSTTCGATLAIGASCTITFTAATPEGPTIIPITGSNTNTVNVVVTVTPVPTALISVSPTTLLFAENSTGLVTVTNDVSSLVTADNVVATIPGGSTISVQSTTCGASLAIGASCTITFASSAQEGPTLVPIAGTNTNTVNINITVTSQPQISITGPIQSSRVVTVSGAALNLQITNDAGSPVNANAITVSNQAACPNLTVDDSNCTSVAPSSTCTLVLNSPDPYAPCTITVSGSNTANSPTTLIAFSYLGGLVFTESGGTGKVVLESGFGSQWTSSVTNIAGAVSMTDGVANTNAIIADASCSGDTTNCAAYQCRNLGGIPTPAWYMPALNELVTVNTSLCGNGTIPCNFGNFVTTIYWSSTQNNAGMSDARVVNFPSGITGLAGKTETHPVHCIQSF